MGGSRTGLRVVLEGVVVQIYDLALRRHAGEGGQGQQGEREGVSRARHRDFRVPVACGARVEVTTHDVSLSHRERIVHTEALRANSSSNSTRPIVRPRFFLTARHTNLASWGENSHQSILPSVSLIASRATSETSRRTLFPRVFAVTARPFVS